jgi:hypothetical protein
MTALGSLDFFRMFSADGSEVTSPILRFGLPVRDAAKRESRIAPEFGKAAHAGGVEGGSPG